MRDYNVPDEVQQYMGAVLATSTLAARFAELQDNHLKIGLQPATWSIRQLFGAKRTNSAQTTSATAHERLFGRAFAESGLLPGANATQRAAMMGYAMGHPKGLKIALARCLT
ncbi:hypothetical protein [Bradyrhizobium sp. ARR65]|uniref:hypothetical protein n=1 Tax=Bradyrhizobium sp. ARR65 TaxID=1040989 RepID=UPI0004652E0B|nr:hypothetical protein [Bradyrhizobium sp. ARR65]